MAAQDPNVQREVTTAEQASARNYAAKSVRTAALRWDPVPSADPFSMKRIFIGIAIAACIVITVIGAVQAWLKPRPNTGIGKYMVSQLGGAYVLYTDPEDKVERLHEVYNTASAYLIANSAERPKIVKDEILSKYPAGMKMGIPGAPNSLLYRSESESAWQVCDWHDGRTNLSLTKADSLRTTIIAGNDTRKGGDSLGPEKAVIVRTADSPQPWLLFRNTRSKVGREDYTMHAALGVSTADFSSPMVVSDGLLNSIPPVPDLTLPKLKDMGKGSPSVPGFAIGDVLAYRDVDNTDRYAVVESDGVQDVPFIVARMVVNNGGAQKNVQESATVAHMKRTSEIPLNNYPTSIPRVISPDTLCFAWNKKADSNRAEIDIRTDSALPVTDDARKNTVDLMRGISSDAASKYISMPGQGWYVRFTGEGEYSEAREQIAYIDTAGILYPIVPDKDGVYTQTAHALGLYGTPNLIPASIASLFLPGPDLSFSAAKVKSVQSRYQIDPLRGGGKAPGDADRVIGGQDIPIPPEKLPTQTQTQIQTQTQTATVTAPSASGAPPAPGGSGAPSPGGGTATPPRGGGGAATTPARPAPTTTAPPR